jgi:NADH:ubiquinone oxidoreductase subunit K
VNVPTQNILLAGVLGLVGVGLYGLLALRNLLKIVIALQILIKASVLALVWAGTVSGQIDLGQSLAITVIVTDTIVAVVGLALAIRVKRSVGTLDIRELGKLRG